MEKLVHWKEQLQGPKRLLDITPHNTFPFTLTGLAMDGYQIEIRCAKRIYREDYPRIKFVGQKRVMYDVSACVTQDAPERLRRACELRVSFPAFFGHFVSEERQQKLAIDIYLDRLRECLEEDCVPA